MRYLPALLLVLPLAACGAATSSLAPGALGISARDAYLEARTEAQSWDGSARLRYVEGEDIAATGMALPEAGVWRFHYSAAGRSQALLVSVSPLATAREERAPTSPPGYVLGDNALGGSWIDSPAALDAALSARGAGGEAAGGAGAAASLLLVPTVPAQWIVTFAEGEPRRVHLDATSGDVLRR